MNRNPILIVDDDPEDIELIKAAIEKLNIEREILYFENGPETLEYLKNATDAPFLILSDVNLPGMDGFGLRERVGEDEETKYKSVPFIFWSTSASEKQIQQAYDLPAQGFFVKPGDFKELCDTLGTIVAYWNKSQHPKKVV